MSKIKKETELENTQVGIPYEAYMELAEKVAKVGEKKYPWKTMYNSVPDPGEFNSLPSLVQKNQSMTVLEILDRHKRGIPVNVSQGMPMYYGEEFEMPVWERMDLQERLDYIAQWKADIKEAKGKYVEQESARKKKEFEEKQAEITRAVQELNKAKDAGAASGSEGGASV